MEKHGGNIRQAKLDFDIDIDENVIDFSANINPLGTIDGIKNLLIESIKGGHGLDNYPESNAQSLAEQIGKFYECSQQNIVVGNGANQLIHLLPKLFYDSKKNNVLLISPIFSEYDTAFKNYFPEQLLDYFSLVNNDRFQIDFEILSSIISDYDVVILSNPSTPAGILENREKLLKLIKNNHQTTFIIDESFIDFCIEKNQSFLDFKIDILPKNLIIIKSLTKSFAIAGLRLGLAFSVNVQLMNKLQKLVPAWSINSLALITGCKIFENKQIYSQFLSQAQKNVEIERKYLISELKKIPNLFVVENCSTDFILIKLLSKNVNGLREILLKKYKILIRDCDNFKFLEDKNYFRIAVKNRHENNLLINALNEVLNKSTDTIKLNSKKRIITPSLMFQGTCSNAGKSILTSAMCRILKQDGVNVAPFKAQNMALNSFVTEAGHEIGRAQALQAIASKVIADVRMNPILLKPNNDLGSQVVVMGKPTETLRARDYYKRKRELFSTVKKAYDSLADEYDCVILEGAGSPGEINLKQNDIVNMNMARHAKTNVLLVGDIDRGGVYASFIGTYATFLPWERELLKGFIVNKFRGDQTLLADAHEYLFDYTQKPCLGVIPTFNNITLPEEDSVSFDLPVLDINQVNNLKNSGAKLDVAVIGLRHISNFTDVAPLIIEKDLIVRKVNNAEEFGKPDVVIIPGSKNVISDMNFLQKSKLAELIIEHVKKNKKWLIGICGGLQICGKIINDPYNIESEKKSCKCLNLLPLETLLAKEKTLTQSIAKVNDKLKINEKLVDCNVCGYEIHHGETFCENSELISMYNESSKTPIGFTKEKIWTTYLHGIFDDDNFRNKFLNIIREDFSVPIQKNQTNFYDTDGQLDKLAEHVRKNINLDVIYELMGI